MRISEIGRMPTEITAKDAKEAMERGCRGFHESLTKSYHILEKVKELLDLKTDQSVILELIYLMESNEFMPYGYFEWEYEQSGTPLAWPSRVGYFARGSKPE